MPGNAVLPEDQYRLLIEYSPMMIWRSGPDARCDYFNETWLAFTGRTLEQEIGDGWAQGVHPGDLDRCLKIYLGHFEVRQPFEMEYRLRRYDGVYRYVQDRGVPFLDDKGGVAGYVGSCIDVHERRLADRAKTTFLSLMAHGLRTPLTSVTVFIEGVRRRLARGQQVQDEVFVQLLGQVRRFGTMVDQLEDTVRLEEGRELDLALEEVDLGGVVGGAARLREQGAAARVVGNRGHRLSLAAGAGPFLVEGDRRRLEQVVAHLLENAIKYSPEGGEIRMVLRTSQGGGEHVLSISDPGIGIPAEEVPLVTRRYYRASNASADNYPGLGLGLAISKEIMERHGGRLEITSELGSGTTVSVVLPVARGRAS